MQFVAKPLHDLFPEAAIFVLSPVFFFPVIGIGIPPAIRCLVPILPPGKRGDGFAVYGQVFTEVRQRSQAAVLVSV